MFRTGCVGGRVRGSGIRVAAWAGLSAMAAWMAACAGGGGGGGAGGTRPTVNASAAEVAGPTASLRGLSFFDELETRSLVAHDDALEGVLLLATGRGASTYRQRVDAARALGIVDAGFDRPAREASTIGEVAQMVTRVLMRENAAELDQQGAVGALVQRGILPPPARTYQGLTGAQLVSILGAADDIMRDEGVARLTMPSVGAGRDEPKPAEAAAGAMHTEPLPAIPASEGPTARATREREAAERAQVSKALKNPHADVAKRKPLVWIAPSDAPSAAGTGGSGTGGAEGTSASAPTNTEQPASPR